jgi:hypothetical protein
MRTSNRACVAILALFLAAPSDAQRLDSLPSGSRVRVWRTSAPGRITGILERSDSGGLVFSSRWRPTARYPYADIRAIAVGHREARPGGAARGARRGLMFGAAVGVVATGITAVYESNRPDSFGFGTVIVGLQSIAFMGVTTAVGAIIGATDRTRWQRVWP